jgi:hypothetical protein
LRADLSKILAAADAGTPVADIAAANKLSAGRVYSILREHRPDRARKARRTTSDIPRKVRGLKAKGMAPTRVAFLLGVTPAYVYRILSEART